MFVNVFFFSFQGLVFKDEEDGSESVSSSRWCSNRIGSLVGQHSCSLEVNEELEQFLKQDLENKNKSSKFNEMLVFSLLVFKFIFMNILQN